MITSSQPNRHFFRRSWLWLVLIALLLAACEPSPPPGATSLLEVRQASYTEEGVEGCHLCHAGEFNRSVAATPHGNASNPATPYGQHGCESCHGPGSFHVSRAHGGKGVPDMIQFGSGPDASGREEQIGACQACHQQATGGSAAVAFENSAHDLPFVNCSTCHVMHAEVEPLSSPARQAEICLDCHRKMRDGHPQIGTRPLDFSRQACSLCHAVH